MEFPVFQVFGCSETVQRNASSGAHIVVRAHGLLNAQLQGLAWRIIVHGNHAAAITTYEQAAQAAQAARSTWNGPLFNLALLHFSQRDYARALAVIGRAIAVDDDPPCQTLKLRIQKAMRPGDDVRPAARVALRRFAAPKDLKDWELHWLLRAADLAGDDATQKAAEDERRVRRNSGQRAAGAGDAGVFPDRRDATP